MKKNFVFDTNVLLTDPNAIHKFGDNNIVIPITVIEELDKFKRDLNGLGRNARETARLLDQYRAKGSLSKGVPLDNGGTLRVLTDLGKEPPLPFPTLEKSADGLILAAALVLKKREDIPMVFVTRDINLRLRADAVGLTAQNYEEEDMVSIDELYSGCARVEVKPGSIKKFRTEGSLPAEEHGLLSNQCAILADAENPGKTALGRYHASVGKVFPLGGKNQDIWGISPRNDEQKFAFDLLLDDTIKVVTLMGKAGTGKTLLAIAAGLRKVVDDRTYSRLVVSRPIMPMGKELGFLPGEVGDKLRPWMEPIFDNLDLIMSTKSGGSGRSSKSKAKGDDKKGSAGGRKETKAASGIRRLLDSGLLDVQALTYIRGRSLPGQYLIVDEAQNLTHHEVKTIITRAGEGTKVVLTGDPHQIDNPFLDSTTNGLSVVVQRFKNQALTGHITLTVGERSELAELATNLL
jgi:PhoH-like ATPase